MTRIAPKLGRGGRAMKSENFAVNEPGREPFYVHAYHAGIPEQCADLQASGGEKAMGRGVRGLAGMLSMEKNASASPRGKTE